MSIPFFNDEHIEATLTHSAMRQVLDQAFTDLAAENANVHARHRSDCQEVKLSTMGAVWSTRHLACVKSYTTIGGTFCFVVTVFDTLRNRPLAILEASALTRFRTAGLTCLVAEKALVADARKLALFGAGLQGRAQLEALCQSVQWDEIAIVDPQGDTQWCQAFGEQTGCRVTLCEGMAAVQNADMVVTATRSKEPVFDGEWLKPGALVVAMGTSLPDGRELDDSTLRRAAWVGVEWKRQSLVEAGEIVLGMGSGALQLDRIVDLPDLYRQTGPWRTSAQDIIVFKSVGIGLADLAGAALIVEAA